MPGPLPKDPSKTARPNVKQQFIEIKRDVRKGAAAPSWPIESHSLTSEEQAFWDQLWQKPQSIMWLRSDSVRVVARYLVIVMEAELPSAMSTVRAEARQLETELGLAPYALQRLRWRIVDSDPADDESVASANVTDIDVYRNMV